MSRWSRSDPAPRPRIASPRRGLRSKDVLRFALAMGGCGLVVLLLETHGAGLWRTLAPLDRATARAAEVLVRASGLEVERTGAVLTHPGGFAFEVDHRCTGLIPVVFWLAGLAALPGRGRAKVGMGGLGVVILVSLNLVRLVSLFGVGVLLPGWFERVHGVLWPGVLMLLLLGLWMRWLRRNDAPAADAGGR